MDKNEDMTAIAHHIALRVFQEVLIIFAQWAGANFQHQPVAVEHLEIKAIATAKKLTDWPQTEPLENEIGALQIVFDAVKLDIGVTESHYWPAWAIENTDSKNGDPQKSYPKIPYPSTQVPDAVQINHLKLAVKATLDSLTAKEWGQLSLLMLILEKYASYLCFGQPDIALFDQVKTTAAVATALGANPDAQHLSLIAGDLSGIQDFIYTISSDGALKSLRARSFTLELVTEEIVQQLLTHLQLPRSTVIYAGGGNLYLLAPANKETTQIVETVRQDCNIWLLSEFQGKVFLALTSQPVTTQFEAPGKQDYP